MLGCVRLTSNNLVDLRCATRRISLMVQTSVTGGVYRVSLSRNLRRSVGDGKDGTRDRDGATRNNGG